MSDVRRELGRGVHDARRAGALAGVPERTLHHWASTGFYLPSVSPEPRARLWSWLDLLALRTIDWVRKEKEDLPRTGIRKIREALDRLDELGIPREQLHEVVVVSRAGDLYFDFPETLIRADSTGRTALAPVLQPIKPYGSGPGVMIPRPRLRIIPGKLLGEPHLVDTRITSATIDALHRDGYGQPEIEEMYPGTTVAALADAVDPEQSLEKKAA
jgi:DNA-binding transcriptional MerR regulator/uncharacterized protein (DUF433 family)